MWTQNEINQELHRRGKRVTQQRRELIEIILKTDWSSSKEIYYEAIRRGQNIGMATVYRMLNVLEEIGAVDRRSYQIVDEEQKFISIVYDTQEQEERNEENGDLYRKIKELLQENGFVKEEDFSIVIRIES